MSYLFILLIIGCGLTDKISGYVIFPEKSEWQITLACKWFTHHSAGYKKKEKEIKKRKEREIGWVKIITYYQVTNVQLGVPCS